MGRSGKGTGRLGRSAGIGLVIGAMGALDGCAGNAGHDGDSNGAGASGGRAGSEVPALGAGPLGTAGRGGLAAPERWHAEGLTPAIAVGADGSAIAALAARVPGTESTFALRASLYAAGEGWAEPVDLSEVLSSAIAVAPSPGGFVVFYSVTSAAGERLVVRRSRAGVWEPERTVHTLHGDGAFTSVGGVVWGTAEEGLAFWTEFEPGEEYASGRWRTGYARLSEAGVAAPKLIEGAPDEWMGMLPGNQGAPGVTGFAFVSSPTKLRLLACPASSPCAAAAVSLEAAYASSASLHGAGVAVLLQRDPWNAPSWSLSERALDLTASSEVELGSVTPSTAWEDVVANGAGQRLLAGRSGGGYCTDSLVLAEGAAGSVPAAHPMPRHPGYGVADVELALAESGAAAAFWTEGDGAMPLYVGCLGTALYAARRDGGVWTAPRRLALRTGGEIRVNGVAVTESGRVLVAYTEWELYGSEGTATVAWLDEL